MDGVGFLFITSGANLRVSDGDTVKLGGHEWHAQLAVDGGLQLTTEHAENNAREQVRGLQADIKNELEHRKQEVQALRAQRAELETKMEQVITCALACASHARCIPRFSCIGGRF